MILRLSSICKQIACVGLMAGLAAQTAPVTAGQWDFEKQPAGKTPLGWTVGATNRHGPLATWQVVADPDTPSGKQALALTRPNHNFGGTFNLCWNENIRFRDGIITVAFKANAGEEDQGGGVVWRFRNEDNYYIARYNPLENNFRLYYVKDGARRMLASARIALPAHVWQTMKIVQDGNRISGFLNGKKYLEVRDDTFPDEGTAGFWTKADAATSFDDFRVLPLTRNKTP